MKKKSPTKRIEPAPRACQPITITTKPSLYCAEGLTGLYLLGACEILKFQNSISRNNWGSQSCDSGIITHSYRTFGTVSFMQKAQEDWRTPLVSQIFMEKNIGSSDFHLFRSMTHALSDQHFTSYKNTKNWVDLWIALKNEVFFQRGIRMLQKR